ncbi:SDR family NAD(P)-dependent oxidoreductase [Streptomyces atratus]
MACRFPEAPSPGDYWRLLHDGRSAISRSPETGRHEGTLPDRDRFDAGFFGISPREANAMDPQQRLTLELSWEALESAGLLPFDLRGSDTGVFLGVSAGDYDGVVRREGAAPLTHHAMTGTHRSIIANRVSYALDLHGPSITVDTGQASSLAAVHLACTSLRGGESSLALVGGVQLNITEEGAELAAAFGGLSPDGRSRAFDAQANGFVRGEGAGLVVLKPLARALADGNRVHAVIRGSAVNHGGKGEGLTVPSAAAQSDVMLAAHRQARVAPEDVQYVELHGTGTKVGDPIEAAALGAVFGADRRGRGPLRVGSVKTNIGHLEAAAGIAGLLKVTLALAHGVIPPSLNFETPNPEIDLDGLGLRVQTRAEQWPAAEGASLTAGVSSFSMGGTNCHLVVSAAPPVAADAPAAAGPSADDDVAHRPHPVPVPWVLSGRSAQALRDQAGRLRDHVVVNPSHTTADIGYSLATTRTAFAHRAVVLAANRADFVATLDALALGSDTDTSTATGTEADRGRGAVSFAMGNVVPDRESLTLVFPATADACLDAGRELLTSSEEFADRLAECDQAFAPYGLRPVADVLRSTATRVPGEAEACVFSVMVALAAVWRAYGVRPDAVSAGPGPGAVAAAVVRGLLTPEEGAHLVAADGVPPGDEEISGPPAADTLWLDATGRLGVRTPDTGAWSTPDGAAAGQGFAVAVGQLYVRGVPVDWSPAFAGTRPRDIELPSYAFQRESYWWPAAGAGAGTADDAAPESSSRSEVAAEETVFAVVREVLGGDFDGRVALRDLGFDSLMLAALRDRLSEVTGLDLPSTVVFDHPTPLALGAFLGSLLVDAPSGVLSVDAGAAVSPVSVGSGGSGSSGVAVDPVVIVGMACRFPGGVVSPEGLWDVVVSGRDVVSGFPVDRGWGVGVLSGEVCGVREGGFVEGVGLFDAGFFGVSPREAAGMDPAQRLLLEVSWEVLERAGVAPGSLRGRGGVGVFVGGMGYEYGPRLWEGGGGSDGYLLTGSAGGMLSGRLAYVLGVEGPALTVDTACSSSLVALHLAVGSLRSGECDVALVGGATVMGTPGAFVEFSRQGGLAGDGRCRSFSSDASGTGWSEGVGMLLVERLSVARRLGHRVLAVVAGSGVNSDGASNGLTAPSGVAQQRVVRRALVDAGVSALEVDVVEGHGTGTVLGDPIEVGALVEVFGRGRPVGRPLWLGSLKSNIGHAQAAAGVGGVIKMVEALRRGVLPRTLHVVEPVGGVEWGGVRLLTEEVPWVPAPGALRRAGVSSFGISGTNAHVILEEAPALDGGEKGTDGAGAGEDPLPVLREPVAGEGAGALPLVLSAKTPTALRAQARRLHDFLSGDPGNPDQATGGNTGVDAGRASVTDPGREAPLDLSAVAYTAACVQSGFDHRAAVMPAEGGDYRAGLAALATGRADDLLSAGTASGRSRAVLVFGAGAGMGADAAHASPDLAAQARELMAASPVFADRVRECADALSPHLGRYVGDMTPADPPEAVAFVVGVGLARLWERCGIRPDAAVGQGVGEIVAAHVTGVLSLDEAARLCAACVRGGSVEELRAALAGVVPRRMKTDFCSSRTGRPLDADRELISDNWLRGLRETTGLDTALRHLMENGRRTLVAMPSVGRLVGTLRDQDAGPADVVDALRPGGTGAAGLLEALAAAYTRGLPVDWKAVLPRRPLVVLPTYPFERRRYWLNAEAPRPPQSGGHPLLDTAVTLADRDARALTGALSTFTHPWLADHTIGGETVVPGAALVELAAHIAALDGAATVTELTQEAPVRLPADGKTVEVQFVVGAVGAAGEQPFTVYARPGRAQETARGAGEDRAAPDWTRHATGVLAPRAPRTPADFDLAEWPPPAAEPVELDGIYERLAEAGYEYGPAFRGLRAAWRLGADMYLDVRLPAGTDTSGYGLHPALLDAALHATVWQAAADGRVRLPFSWSGVRLYDGGATELRVRVSPAGPDAVALRIADQHGTPMAAVDALVLRAAAAGPVYDGLFRVAWRPLPGDFAADTAPDADACWVLGSALGTGFTAVPDVAEAGARMDAGVRPPAAVLVPCLPAAAADGGAQIPDDVRRAARGTLELLQSWLDDDRFADTRLVFVTRGAVRTGTGSDEAPVDLVHAPLWGLVRTAQSEEPGRFVLLDLDEGLDTTHLGYDVLAAVATGDEPELALRGGALLVPRLSGVAEPDTADPASATAPAPDLAPQGTVLVTGGTGALGARIARHLVAQHGVRHLLLISRRGAHAPGAEELGRELGEMGAEVRIAACNGGDREALAAVLGSVPAAHPLTGIVHAAGIVQDATVRSLTAAQLDAVLRPKADAAWNLHELTRSAPLAFFDLFSSASGTLGAAGQGNYSLANTFLDALAQHRSALGLPARSLAWGLWDLPDGMAGRLTAYDVERLARRTGLRPIDPARGLRMFDAARTPDLPTVVAAALDPAFALANGLTTTTTTTTTAAAATDADPTGTAWSQRIAGLPEAERAEESRRLVMSIAGEVLGGGTFDGGLAFRDMGFDSLLAVELRNRLCEVTGVRLPSTVVFDHPTPLALGAFLGSLLVDASSGVLSGDAGAAVSPVSVGSGGSGSSGVAVDPVVIVGMACRFPGGVVSPEGLWDVVVSGRDVVSGFPVDRGWGVGVLSGEVCGVREGGFVEGVGLFDAGFFGVSPREAAGMDPAQRLLLEVSWEVLERAGVAPGSLRGRGGVGVFVGGMGYEYGPRLWEGGGGSDGYLLTGSAGGMLSGRLAYVLGVEGPALTVDTACSSSLVALHLAVGSLRSGECDVALVGGATVMGTPGAFVEFSRQGGLAGDGRCRSFSSDASGTGWSEGVGMLLVERLSVARRLGHRVLAVVAGSGVNSDGASNGLTAPSGVAQQRVVRRALVDAGVSALEVDVVEGHGTGTVLGDPIEVGALVEVFGRGRPVGRPLWLGSLKSNIGHAQAAAGVGGVIKMVEALRRGVLPRTLHVVEPVGGVEWGGVRLLTEEVPWVPAPGALRRAGVSSFGISGTNAHVILEEAPALDGGEKGTDGAGAGEDPLPVLREPVAGEGAGALPLVLSAKTPTALRAQARRLHELLSAPAGSPDLPAEAPSSPDPAAVTYTAARVQSGFGHRAAVVAEGGAGLLAGLAALAEDRTATGVSRGVVSAVDERRVFMFAGQGTQRPGMGKQLYERFPVYAEAFDEACAAFAPHLERPLASVVLAHPAAAQAAALHRTGFTQPALFATEFALFKLVRSWGVRPDIVLGHSIGELVAAHVAGVFSLPDAAELVSARGRLMQSLPPAGAMVAVRAGLADVEPLLTDLADEVGIAAVNGPEAVVVSGASEAVSAVVTYLRAAGHRTTALTVSHAFHSPLMAPILDEFREIAAGLTYRRPVLPIVSNVTGRMAEAAELMSPDYWADHIRRPVRFADGIAAARAEGGRHFVEIGPDSTLSSMASAVLTGLAEDRDADEAPGRPVVVPLLRGGRDEARAAAEGLATAFTSGLDVDWPAVAAGWGGELTTLPTYPFERRRYWLNPTEPGTEHPAGASAGPGAPRSGSHPVLGRPLDLPDSGDLVWSGYLDPARFPWLADHVVAGRALMPGSLLAELACHVARDAGCDRVEELVLQSPLVLPDGAAVELRLVVRAADGSGRRPFAVHARTPDGPGADWQTTATGILAAAASGSAAPVPPAAWPPAGAESLPLHHEGDYAGLAARGLSYGPAFRGLRALWRTADGICAELEPPAAIASQTSLFGLHPALLDAALHPVELHGLAGEVGAPGIRVPFTWRGMTHHVPPNTTRLRVRLTAVARDEVAVELFDTDGNPVLSVEALSLRSPSPADDSRLRRLSWTAADRSSESDRLPEDEQPDRPGPPEHREMPERFALIVPGGATTPPPYDALHTLDAEHRSDVAQLVRQASTGVPDAVVVPCPAGAMGDVGEVVGGVLAVVQEVLAEPALARCRVVVVTRHAVGTGEDDPAGDAAAAAVWGLARCAQQEEPGRVQLVDIDPSRESAESLGRAIRSRLAQVALRKGEWLTPEPNPLTDRLLDAPAGGSAWRLDFVGRGTPDDLALVDWPDADEPLREGQVRVALHAAGVNFRDVLLTLGVVEPRAGVPEGEGQQSVEGAGVVIETGPGVDSVRPGDRVMGLFDGIGPVSVTEERLLGPVPAHWSFAQAAAVPVAFLTAYYGLVELGRLRAGERVLVHTATGAVGFAARQLALHLGAEVFATASPAKWPVLRSAGLDADHLASSRDDTFETAFRAASGGVGMDVVLNSLAGPLTDASLRTLAPGGRFLEMGKTDPRDPDEVAAAHGGAAYTVFDIRQAGPDGIRRMLAELLRLFEDGTLTPPPVTLRHVRDAPAAYRYVAEARHVGKVVLAVRDFDTDRAVLISGGLGTLGVLVARHLVTRHAVRDLVLIGRRGPETPGSAELAAELRGLGARVTVAACDAGDREALAALLDELAERGIRIGSVVHAAGTTRDAAIGSLTRDAVTEVLRAKAVAALNLHELTADLGLSSFVLFSSVAGVTGSAGQGNYAAANAFLDALAEHRRARSLPALSIAWGLWEPASGITGRLRAQDHERLARQGIRALSAERGLALLDEALATGAPTVVAARLTLPSPPAHANGAAVRTGGTVAEPRGSGTAVPASTAAAVNGAGSALSSTPVRRRSLLELVRAEAASVLGHDSPEAVAPDALFPQLGFDSLGAIELRNRIVAATGIPLLSTLIYDFPTPKALAGHLREECPDWAEGPEDGESAADAILENFRKVLAENRLDAKDSAVLAERLQAMLTGNGNGNGNGYGNGNRNGRRSGDGTGIGADDETVNGPGSGDGKEIDDVRGADHDH